MKSFTCMWIADVLARLPFAVLFNSFAIGLGWISYGWYQSVYGSYYSSRMVIKRLLIVYSILHATVIGAAFFSPSPPTVIQYCSIHHASNPTSRP